ncbi:MAG: hypothetical protein ACYDDS_00175 [Candidatus Sulfotelmatobacter sp.]
MGSLRFGAGAWVVVTISLFLFLPACGGSKPPGASPFPAKVTLNPSNSFSMQVGATQLLTATAQNGTGTAISPAFTFASSNPSVVDIAPNGFACAGTWNAPLYSICTPNGIGTAQVTASALGATSPPTLFFVHPAVDTIKISIAPPVNSPPPPCPSQVALPATCNLKFNPTNLCLSQNQVQTLQATAYSQGVDVTASVGPFNWSEVNANVVKITPIVNTDINVATYQATAAPSAPGQTQVIASASGVSSQPYIFETCPVQCIALELGTPGSGETSFSVIKGTAETVTATAVDVQGCIVPKAPLTWISSAPAAIGATCTLGSATCNVTTPQPGSGAVTANCTPPNCNIGFPLNPSAFPAGSIYIPKPVYPVTAISGLATGATVSTSVLATTQDCSADAFCGVGIYNVSTSTHLPGAAAQSPTPPNSLLFDAAGDRAFMGSEFGALVVNPANFGGSASPFTSLSAPATTLGLVTGKILAVALNGGTAIFSDTVSTPNQVYVVNASPASTTPLNINSAIAAAVSPDGLKDFILGNGGNTLYVYSALQALQTFPLAAPATSIAFNSTGSFALLAGGAPSPSTLVTFNTCDNSQVNLPLPSLTPPAPGLPGPPQFLKMVPASTVPMGNSIIPTLDPAGLDFFFGADNTGIDIMATTSSPAPVTALCPQPVTLGQVAPIATPPAFFPPTHINLGYGTFHPINFFLSPDTSQAFVVTTDFGVLVYSFNTSSVTRIQLVNDAAPVTADIAADGSLIYVAASDGLLHELNTATGLDQNQTSFIPLPNSSNDFCFSGSNCALNLLAVKP